MSGAAASVTDALGRVERKVGSGWKSVSVGDALPEGSVLRTGDDAAALLRLPDGHSVRVGEKTTLEVKRLGGQSGFGFKVISGQIWSMVRKTMQPTRFEVETTSAVAGVTGTLFCVAVDEESGDTAISTGEGSVAVRGIEEPEEAATPVRQGFLLRFGLRRPRPRAAMMQGQAQRAMWRLLHQEGAWSGRPGARLRRRRRMEQLLRRHLWGG